MEFKGTPGPWECWENGKALKADDWEIENTSYGMVVSAPVKVNGEVIAFAVQGKNELDFELVEVKANLQLIASAPDLLHALVLAEKTLAQMEYLCGDADDSVRVEPSLLHAREAIKRALGEKNDRV